jgi:hypothetical protein
MPDPQLTPGAVADTDPVIICAPGYSRSHWVWHDKIGTLAKYGIPPADADQYEDDDRVPICLGGDNASALNHWPEPWDEAEQKDELKGRMSREVAPPLSAQVCRCHGGGISSNLPPPSSRSPQPRSVRNLRCPRT